ncbi:MAG: dephospho-CoA kinase [Bacteroidota bacterium]
MDRPLQVGITGGIGSGKSLISRIFKSLGVPVYDADSHARNLMSTDALLIDQIKIEFGDDAYKKDGSLDRGYLSFATFGKKDRLEKLNSFVHPRVAADYARWSDERSGFPYVLREAALLYEIGADASVDKMIVVSAPEDLRINRIIQRDPQRTIEQIRAIINSQWPEEEKLKRADYIIYNNDSRMVIPQVLEIHQNLLR